MLKTLTKVTIGWLFKHLLTIKTMKDFNIVIMYHRVAPVLPKAHQDLFVTVDSLENHIRELSLFFDIVPLNEITSTRNGDDKNKCAITFDDGWLDNYTYAFPILKKYEVPATIFIPITHIDSDNTFWFESLYELSEIAQSTGRSQEFAQYFISVIPSWDHHDNPHAYLDDLAAKLKLIEADRLDSIIRDGFKHLDLNQCPKRLLMNWSEMSEMGRHGVAFGSHGLHHYILTTVEEEQKREEIFESFNMLRSHEVPVAPFFSYPNGNFDDDTVRLVAEVNYQGAVTTRLGYNTSNTYPYLLNRIPMHEYVGNKTSLLWYRVLQALMAGSD